jgi:hypothetical protein
MAEQTTSEFWAARDAHVAEVRQALQAVADKIQEGVAANLYRDGITTKLNDCNIGVLHHITQLTPAAQPAA